MLYNYFNNKLSEQIKALDLDKVEEDVRLLRDLNKALRIKCSVQSLDYKESKGTPFQIIHTMVQGWSVNTNCTYMAMSEPFFAFKIRDQQLSGRPPKRSSFL